MTQVQGFVGIGRGVLYHHQRTFWGHRTCAKGGVSAYLSEHRQPIAVGDDEVQEALYGIVTLHLRSVLDEVITYFGCHLCGSLAGKFDERKNNDGQMSFVVLASFLKLYERVVNLCVIELFNGFFYVLSEC